MHIIRSKKRKFNLILCSLTTSVVLIISGIILILMRTFIHNKAMGKLHTLEPGEFTYDLFKKTPFDIYFDIYMFNWTNPEDFHDSTKKPVFKEVGPFRFQEIIEKTNITFHENNTISYNRTRRWYFKAEQSISDLDAPITTINPVAVSGAYTLRDQSFFMRKGFSVSLNSIMGRIDVTKSVGEMLFFGYDDVLINVAKTIPFVSKNLPPMDKFGWFYTRNNSNTFDGRFNMGIDDLTFGQLKNWNFAAHTPYYDGKCSEITGSAGDFFPKPLTKGNLNIFNVEMCRTIVMDYDGESSRKFMRGYQYTLGDHFLDNGTLIPENQCYCTGECVPYGMMNISLCRYGSPGFVSLPHFYKADPYYLNLVKGLEPSDRHNFYMILEPNTGIPLEIAARLQVNLMVRSVPGISLLSNINDIFFPMLWFEQVFKIPYSFAFGLFILLWIKEICIVVGTCMAMTGILVIYYIIYRICTTNICGKRRNKDLFIKELVPLNQEKDDAIPKILGYMKLVCNNIIL
ncbi:hypothetical protein HHI36_008325 [Cryptolaemus montrouzieri]